MMYKIRLANYFSGRCYIADLIPLEHAVEIKARDAKGIGTYLLNLRRFRGRTGPWENPRILVLPPQFFARNKAAGATRGDEIFSSQGRREGVRRVSLPMTPGFSDRRYYSSILKPSELR